MAERKAVKMTGPQLKAARQTLGLTQMVTCCLLGVSRATLARWEAGQTPVPRAVAMLVPRLVKESKTRPKGGK
jgi:DNA-binding transcriptional regulator YiaG